MDKIEYIDSEGAVVETVEVADADAMMARARTRAEMLGLTARKYTPEPTEEEEAAQERERLNAMTATRFQAKAALDDADLLDSVEAYMAGDDVPRRVKLAWEEASFRRGSQMIADIGAELGLTEEQIDGLFIAAQEIEV